jgi:hypothetical protein
VVYIKPSSGGSILKEVVLYSSRTDYEDLHTAQHLTALSLISL